MSFSQRLSKLKLGAVTKLVNRKYHAVFTSSWLHVSRQSSLSNQVIAKTRFLSCLSHSRNSIRNPTRLKNLNLVSHHFSTTNFKMKYGGNKMLHDSYDSPETEDLKKLLDNNLSWDNFSEHQVLIVQPYIKWGPDKKTNTNPDLMLAEAAALVKSLQHWKILHKKKVGLQQVLSESYFGPGQVDALVSEVHGLGATAIFISVDKLTNEQYYFLANRFQVPVFDRYSLVVQIFKEHAKSPEAKLQVSMAELPYIVGRHLSPHYDRTKKILMKYQKKMQLSLEKLKRHRTTTRKSRHELGVPIVAVVGYTNAGKTSLIKALTKSESLTPENVLFATLDVTMHEGFLPCNLKVLFADTIGFISDLPAELIEPFRATLEDAMLADVIVHVMDVSHPNHPAQYDEVIYTLERLNLSPKLQENTVTVGNKSDLVPHEKLLEIPSSVLLVSATEGIGLNQLLSQLEKLILRTTDRHKLTVRVKTNSEEECWLKKEAAITSADADPKDPTYSLLKVVITSGKLDAFKQEFIGSKD